MDASPLARLPPQLRNIIYNRVLVQDAPTKLLWVLGALASSNRKPSNFNTRIALLETCRQIHMEAAPIFYGNNTFSVLDTYARSPKGRLASWFRDLRSETRKLVRRVTIMDLGYPLVALDVQGRLNRVRRQVEVCSVALQQEGLMSDKLVFTVTVNGKEFGMR